MENSVITKKTPLTFFFYFLTIIFSSLYAGTLSQDILKQNATYFNSHFTKISEVKKSESDASFIYDLGKCYYFGIGVEESKEKAIKLLIESSRLKESDAALLLSYYYLVLKKDTGECLKWLKYSSKEGNLQAKGLLDYLFFFGGILEFVGIDDLHSKSFDEIRLRAINGDQASQLLLGEIYYANKEYKQAFSVFKEIAEKGNSIGLLYLGECYYYGRGVEQSYKRAFEYFSKSESAQLWIGKCYYYGHGVTQDFSKAFDIFNEILEMDKTNIECKVFLGQSYLFGNGVDVDYKKAVEYFSNAAGFWNPDGEYWLSYCYYFGKGVDKDLVNALILARMYEMQGGTKSYLDYP